MRPRLIICALSLVASSYGLNEKEDQVVTDLLKVLRRGTSPYPLEDLFHTLAETLGLKHASARLNRWSPAAKDSYETIHDMLLYIDVNGKNTEDQHKKIQDILRIMESKILHVSKYVDTKTLVVQEESDTDDDSPSSSAIRPAVFRPIGMASLSKNINSDYDSTRTTQTTSNRGNIHNNTNIYKDKKKDNEPNNEDKKTDGVPNGEKKTESNSPENEDKKMDGAPNGEEKKTENNSPANEEGMKDNNGNNEASSSTGDSPPSSSEPSPDSSSINEVTNA